ncbi:NAD-binding protein [Candidatus Lokiarchaeum ossiferum]|uniref:NAD-binding protein n=1 Tax=Candidatus Lokiarchaeum ossiferum TaxID=2951803 RepID=UPI00352DBB8A
MTDEAVLKKSKNRGPLQEKFIVLSKFLRRSRMLKVVILVILLNLVLAAIYANIEGIDYHLALYWATDTLTNTGSGLVPPTLKVSWIGTTIFMWLGLGITLVFVEFVYVKMVKNMRGNKVIKFKDHTILIGWNPKIRHFLKNLQGTLGVDHNYVLVADIADRPFDLPQVVEFLRGNPDEERILIRAGMKDAQQAIVATEDDADAVLIAMTIQSININVRICVNLLSEENIKHLKRIGIEQIVCDENLTGNALVDAFYKNQEDYFL